MIHLFRSMPAGRQWAGVVIVAVAVGLVACGGGGSGGGNLPAGYGGSPPGNTGLVVGTIDGGDVVTGGTLLSVPAGALRLTLDDAPGRIAIDAEGNFRLERVADGDHTLHIQHADGIEAHLPFRMLDGENLTLGMITIHDGQIENFTGFNGYHFGFVDEDRNGRNDHFADADGDGVCDQGFDYAGSAYFMPYGYQDVNRDGRNDLFRDADGDGRNDLDGMHYDQGFGFVDDNHDGINDGFRDANGDGICDLSSMPFRHPFGWMDADEDGVNDLFTDGNGDGVNDLTGVTYLAMPGWADLDGDHLNDFFRDANGDGINDLGQMPMGYAHGFGWKDANGDGVNDDFIDADGDGINDMNAGRYGGMHLGYGYMVSGIDVDGDGLDDVTGAPLPQGFGWVDGNHDHMNDYFRDANGDGVNDLTGHRYMGGGSMMGGPVEDTTPGHEGWPAHGHGAGG